MLTLEQLQSLFQVRLGSEIIKCEFDRKTFPMRPDTRTDASWCDHLLRIFSIRLRGAKENNVDSDLITEMQNFVTALESLDRTADLYIWMAHTALGHYGGWATEDRILSCFSYGEINL